MKNENQPFVFQANGGIVSRGDGKSITAVSAYNSGEKLRDVYEGRVHDRSYRQDVVHKEILLPPESPQELLDRQTLLAALDHAERRTDSQMARSIKLALPNEFSLSEQIALLKEFVQENFTKYGLCADIAIHRGKLDESKKPANIEPVGERRDNPHAHILIPFRPVDKHGFCRTKTQTRFLNDRTYLIAWRKSWADILNREFERRKLPVRVSHESLAAQGIDREPTIHLGAGAMALELRGGRTDRGDMYREIAERNRAREDRRGRNHNRGREIGRSR